ncbi:hypothetical protein WQ89_20835 [Escherichia coli]|nr:hypothetical protein WQ89_20835 [Escherichia coli]
MKTHSGFGGGTGEEGFFDAAPAAWKAALRCYIWHKSKTAEARRKPVLIDRFHLTPPQPCQTIPAFSHEIAFVRGRSGPDEGLPEVGAYLRVSGPSGPLTSVYSIHPARRLTAIKFLSYNIHN